MKWFIVIECLVLWAGTIDHYKGDFNGDLTQTVVGVGVHSAIPTIMLLFILLMIADLGADGIAALLGGIISFSYLMNASSLLNTVVSQLLYMAGYSQRGSGGGSSDR